MPFTFSHPAIVLPLAGLNKKYVSPSALIMGSMAPDFEYFIRMRLKQVHGHSLAGVFYFDLPLTILMLIVFHLLVRKTLILHLPKFFAEKYAAYVNYNWRAYAKRYWYVVISSAVIGIFSHLLWDSFTHSPGYFVQFIPGLKETWHIFNVPIPGYDFMQLLSTLIGGMVILSVLIWPVNYKLTWKDCAGTFSYLGWILSVDLLVIWLHGIQDLSEFIATSISGWLIGLVLVSVVLGRRVKV